MRDKKEIVAKGSFITYINFPKVYKFDLKDGHVLRFPVETNQKPLKQFIIEAEVEREPFKEEDIIKKVQVFVNWLSLFFDVPSESLELKEIVSEDSEGKRGGSVRSLSTTGSLGAENTEIKKFADIIKTNELSNRHKYCLELFRRARLMDDLYGNYWQLYVVFIILLYDSNDSSKERKQIDENLKHYAPEMKRIHNDYDNGEWSLFIAIRDSFSHKAKFSGEELDIDKELKENIEEFIEIARDVILDKLCVDV